MVEAQNDTDDLKMGYVIFGGEGLERGLVERWNEKYPDTDLINM